MKTTTANAFAAPLKEHNGTFEAVRGVAQPARIFTPALNYGQTGERALLPCYVGGIFGTLIKMLSNTDFFLRPLQQGKRDLFRDTTVWLKLLNMGKHQEI